MKKFVAALSAALLIASAGAALAGVTIEQQGVTESDGVKNTFSSTLLIQGNKQKTASERGGVVSDQVVTDLDAGKMIAIVPAHKVYVEMPFPPKGHIGQMAAGTMALNFKKTGGHRTVLGYKCDDYTATGRMMSSDFEVVACFSTAPPGAAEYTAFQKTMAAKVKGTSLALVGEVPDGVPLYLKSTSKGMTSTLPRTPAQIVTTTTVTKVSQSNLPADTFTPPPGFVKQQVRMPQAPPATGSGAPSAAPPPIKVPE